MNETAVFPVITLYQPWAAYVVSGMKTIETRTHTRFNGLVGKQVLIHAAMNPDPNVWAWENYFIEKNYPPEALGWALKVASIRGAIIGSAFVDKFGPLDKRHSDAACIECESVQRYGLFLFDIKKWDEPQYVQGSMGIWYYDIANQEKVKKPKLV